MTTSRRTRLERLRALAEAAAPRPGVVFFDALAGEQPEDVARGVAGPVAAVPHVVAVDDWERVVTAGQARLKDLVEQALIGSEVAIAGPFG